MINKKTGKLNKLYAIGGISNKMYSTNVNQLGGNTSIPGTPEYIDSTQGIKRVNVVEDNTNYTADYAMKGAAAGASLMAVNPVVGAVATGVGAGGGAILGAIKEGNAKKANANLKGQADIQQQVMNTAFNNDAKNLATKKDLLNQENQTRRSINNNNSFYGPYNLGKNGIRVKAQDGYFSNKSLGIKENPDYFSNNSLGLNSINTPYPEATPNGQPITPTPKKKFNLTSGQVEGVTNAGIQLAGLIMDYNKPTTGYSYVAAKGMKIAKSGKLDKMSSDTFDISGKSHAEGGIPLTPEVEVEGGETAKDTPSELRIYSDKLKVPGTKKTFADLHRELAKQKGGIEKKIDKYSDRPSAVVTQTVKALGNKIGKITTQEDTLFEIQQSLNGDHSNEQAPIKAANGASVAASLAGGAIQYYNLANRVNQNQKARKTAIEQIAALSIPKQKRLDYVNFDYVRNDAQRADVNTQLQNFRNTVGANTSGNQVGIALTGLMGQGLDRNAQLLQEQENNRVAARNQTISANQEVDQVNNQNAYQSDLMSLERNRDVINDRANLVTDRNKEYSEYVVDNYRKEAFADKELAYQYAGMSPQNQAYLKKQGLSPNHWTSPLNRAIGSFSCGGKLHKAGFGSRLAKDCGCK